MDVRGQHSIANQGFVHHDTPQIRKNFRFDAVAAARILRDSDAGGLHLRGNGHFHLTPQLGPQITANIMPVSPGEFGESNLQSSSGSVKKFGGQSNSFAPLASLNFFSRAGVAA